jgi:hypothetical protein
VNVSTTSYTCSCGASTHVVIEIDDGGTGFVHVKCVHCHNHLERLAGRRFWAEATLTDAHKAAMKAFLQELNDGAPRG